MAALLPVERAGVPFYQFEPLADDARLVHGVFGRHGGVSRERFASLNVSLAVGDERPRVLENRARIAMVLDGSASVLHGARQVHGAEWRVVSDQAQAADETLPADILLTNTPGVLLLMKFADCTPLVLWDPARRWVAVAHAGWRGTARRVAGAAVAALGEAAGSQPDSLWAAIGPAIGPCCYEVGTEVVAAVAAAGVPPERVAHEGRRGRPHLDLPAANRLQLEAAGVRPQRIMAADRCTACEAETFYSHRVLGLPAGRFGVVAGVRG